MRASGAEERGLALGIRQTAIPIGAAAAAASLPWLASTAGTRLAFFALAGSCLAGAGLGGAFLRDAPAAAAPAHAPEERPSPLRDPRMWLPAGGSSLYLVAQISAWSGSRRMPRKMSGIAIRTIEPSMVASNTPRVVFESATHL